MGNCNGAGFIKCMGLSSTWSLSALDQRLSLPAMGAQLNGVTLSGFSGGSAFAAIATVALSDTIDGFGLLGGTPYGMEIYRVSMYEKSQKQ